MADFVRGNKDVTGFGQQVRIADKTLAGDLDVITNDEIIEVKKSLKALTDIEQFDKYINPNDAKYSIPIRKKLFCILTNH